MNSADKMAALKRWLDMRLEKGDRRISAEDSETARVMLDMTEEEFNAALEELARE